MATTPIAYNPGSPISGTTQIGNLAIGTTPQDYSANPGGVKWWMGPNDSTGYIIATAVSGGNQPTQISGVSASVGFYQSSAKTDNSFTSLVNNIFSQNFSNASSASAWLTSNGYWNTYSASASSAFIVTVAQVGPDVVWSGIGSFDLTGLTSAGTNTIGGGYAANQAIWAIGPVTTVDTYSGTITYPTSFGTGGIYVTSNTGSTFGVLPGGSGRTLYLPSGYISNTVISGSATYNSTTIATMGLNTGSYVWTWNSGSSSLTMNIG
jgi:hypothetical protein